MIKVDSTKTMTWRQLLRRRGGPFLEWLGDSGAEVRALVRIANELAEFLIAEVERAHHEWPDAPVEFWRKIPDVRACCNQPNIFEQPFAVQAYAYVHFLERYRRTWTTLKYLTDVPVLPLGIRGVKTLDVGTGPAPALYAIGDFYQTLNEFAELFKIPSLRIPAPELNSVERSQPMIWFFHNFSEFCKRSGPFEPVFNDFEGLDLKGIRGWNQRQNEYEEQWDPETGQYEEVYSPDTASELANSLFRYRLVVFSNFLTLKSNVEKFTTELHSLFRDLRPGAVVIVLGSTGDSYQKIYERVAGIAREEGLLETGWHTDTLGHIEPQDEAARLIKSAQNGVYFIVGLRDLSVPKDWKEIGHGRITGRLSHQLSFVPNSRCAFFGAAGGPLAVMGGQLRRTMCLEFWPSAIIDER